MFPYWILFTVFAAGAVQYRTDPRRMVQGGPLLLVAGLFTALMIGFRYGVGGDWGSYENILYEIKNGVANTRSADPGYTYLNVLTASLGLGLWFVDLVCAILFTWGLVKFARRQPNPWLVMLVSVPYLIIVVAMGYTRQAVAIGFILAGLADFEKGSIIEFIIYMVLAAAFHKSAVAVFPLVALTRSRNRFVTFGIIALSGVIVYYAFVEAAVDKLMLNYVQGEYESSGAWIRIGMNIPPAVFFLLYKKRFKLGPDQEKLWRNFSIASLMAAGVLLTTSASTAVDRLGLYLIPLQMFVWGRFPVAFPDRAKLNMQISVAIIVYSAAVQFIWLNYATNAAGWLPYRIGATNEVEYLPYRP